MARSLLVETRRTNVYLLYASDACNGHYQLYGAYKCLDEAVFNYLKLDDTDGIQLNEYTQESTWTYPKNGSEKLHALYIKEIELSALPCKTSSIVYTIILQGKPVLLRLLVSPDIKDLPCIEKVLAGKVEGVEVDYDFQWRPIPPFTAFAKQT